ncbi:hypothetical protein NEOLEDRAFT_1134845 [Neolentinus lepideus HHB14362 ss-1]|uniref:F-box domain-containing protein n=1 Tax=Neolentinus lepideus HHB14362 ss-1 TaxID=1314782 RepID=A0A165RZL9_9AGAM|nr:hypothetical protein NEOLEDRAFT_1134845 [Neolentinus lepideus HHB14362 ss-1]
MSWKDHFDEGVKAFRSSNLEEALTHFSKAVECGGTHFNVYDSRAAVLERLGRTKDALRDAKATIDADPSRWQGYARASRLFFKLQKYSSSITMAELALERLKNGEIKRVDEVLAIKRKAAAVQSDLAQQEREQRAANSYHFGKLPVEIIVHIFTLHVDTHASGSIVLSHVCQHWRGIALNTPTLWSTLILSRKPIKKALLWHTRSGGMVKELTVRQGVLAAGMPPFKRLRTFRTASHEMTLKHLLDLLDANEREQLTRNLEEIVLKECHTSALVAQEMPALRHLEIRSVGVFDWNAASTHISSLRTLVVHDTSYPIGDVLSLLRANPMLETLSFMATPGKIYLDFGIEPDLTQFPLPCLRSLELGNFDLWSDMFLATISTPSLETLTLTALQSRQDAVLHKLKRDGVSRLRELRMQKCSVSPSTVLQVLEHVDALETLELSHIGGNASAGARMGGDINVVIEALAAGTLGGDGSPLCCSLQHLDISHCPDIKTGPLIRLVKAHLAGGHGDIKPLRSLIMNGCPLIDAETLPWFRSKVPVLSCAYLDKKTASYKR